MSIQKKSIQTFTVSGDQHGDNSKYIWFNDCGESVWVDNKHIWHHCEAAARFPNDDKIQEGKKILDNLLDQRYLQGVQASNLESVNSKLTQLIQQKDAKNFETLLKTDFVYQGLLTSYSTNNDHRVREWSDYREETYLVRPNIEALFTDDHEKFIALINLLLKENSVELYRAFSKSLTNTDLNNSSLFDWNEKIRTDIKKQLDDLEQYGKKLLSKKDHHAKSKGTFIHAITSSLNTKLLQRKFDTDDNIKSKFENLKFKLDINFELHSHDDVFNEHRRGLFRLASSNNHAFFKTKSETKILSTQVAIGLPNEALSLTR